MRKSKFAEQQIIGLLKQAEAGMAVAVIDRKGCFSEATFYKWRAKFGGMDVTEARRLRALEAENAKLKHLLAEAHLDLHALKSVLGVKGSPTGQAQVLPKRNRAIQHARARAPRQPDHRVQSSLPSARFQDSCS